MESTNIPVQIDIPVACGLGVAGMKTRVEEWQDLIAGNLVQSQAIPGGLRLVLRPSAVTNAELRRLVALENSCCAWIDWSIDEGAMLQVEATTTQEQGVTLLREWFSPPESDAGRINSTNRLRPPSSNNHWVNHVDPHWHRGALIDAVDVRARRSRSQFRLRVCSQLLVVERLWIWSGARPFGIIGLIWCAVATRRYASLPR